MDIATKIVRVLETAIIADCQTPYNSDDLTRIKTVVRGKFAEDPTEQGPVVAIHRNHMYSWMDERQDAQMGGPAVEFWARRFSLEITVWPVNQEQNDAEETNGTIISRVQRAVTRADMTNLQDDQGERIIQCFNPVKRRKTEELGGPDDEFGFRTYLFLEYLTELSNS